jgi:hypothetical protein
MSKKSSASLIWRATLLFAIFMGSSAFNFPTPKISQSLEVTCSRQAVFSPRCVDDNRDVLDSLRVANRATGSEQVQKSKKYIQGYENNNLPLIQSISVVVASRRISFLVLSIVLVNFVRSTILKVRCCLLFAEDPFILQTLIPRSILSTYHRFRRVKNSCSMNARGHLPPRTTPSNLSKIETLTWLHFGQYYVSYIRYLTRLVWLLNTIFTLSFAVRTSTLLLTILRTIKCW